jgi:DNA-binding ferritin-like protein
VTSAHSARDQLARVTARLEELAVRIREVGGQPQAAVQELAQQASDLSAEAAELIPRAIAEAEADARGDDADAGLAETPATDMPTA